MAEPSTVKDTAALQHEALSTYEAAATLLQHKAGFAPDNRTPHGVDKWISDAYIQWALCDEFWNPAGIKKKVWNDLEYAVLEKVARVDQDDVSWAGSDFNELALRAQDYGLRVRPIPLEPRTRSPSPPRTASPLPLPPKQQTPLPPPSKQRSTAPVTPRRAATKPTPDLGVPVNKLNLTAPSPDPSTSTSTSRTQAPVNTASSVRAPVAPKPPVPDPSTSNINVAQPLVPNPAKPSGQSSATLQKKPTPRPLTSGAVQSSKATPPSSTATKKLASSMKPKPLAQTSGTTMRLPTQTGVDNSGWGSPAWSPIFLTNSLPHSPTENFVSFPKDFTSPLHKKSDQQLKIGPPSNTTHSEASAQSSSSRPFAVNAPDRSIIPGPDPSLQNEGTGPHRLSKHTPLFFPGTDEDEERIQDDLVQGEQVVGTDGEDNDLQAQDYDAPTPPRDVPMDVDKNEGQQSDEDSSPPPTQSRRKTHRISFVFNDVTGDFEEPHPTIFLPRRPATQEQNPRRSTRPHTSPVDQDAAYLKMTQGSKSSGNKKDKKNRTGSSSKKDAKGKEKEASSLKRSRDDDDAQTVEKPTAKKLKMKETPVDEDEVVQATPVVRKRGPPPSKPPPVTLGISGGGFSEKVPPSAKQIKNGIESIGVLKVDKDFGKFIEVDGRYWNKDVAPFIGEHYTKPCDTCRRRGSHCRKLLTHTVICVRCHYTKQPCKVDGEASLNPVSHYRPKGYDAINTFESALNAIEINNAAISSIAQQYLAGLNVSAHSESIRVQMSRLRECLNPVEKVVEEEDNGDEDVEVEAVAEGVAGPSKKKKAKSG
ncbi:hypothetical protein ARMSODRAFT_1027050 [Armillaria solidipes]|uniref:Uncharacterized protein n=1 Tax=Armillaria solidipes TaxID=1076256 RepID=A0A2H3B7L7_9AGAR|nr:hypothetical protein ARMSODRAFT_1027050 [Armillaria solidipes]